MRRAAWQAAAHWQTPLAVRWHTVAVELPVELVTAQAKRCKALTRMPEVVVGAVETFIQDSDMPFREARQAAFEVSEQLKASSRTEQRGGTPVTRPRPPKRPTAQNLAEEMAAIELQGIHAVDAAAFNRYLGLPMPMELQLKYDEAARPEALPGKQDRRRTMGYVLAKMSGQHAALGNVLRDVAAAVPQLKPKEMLDFQAGPGAAAWAAQETWPGSLRAVTAVEPSVSMAQLGAAVAQAITHRAISGSGSGGADIGDQRMLRTPRVSYMRSLPVFSKGSRFRRKYDIVVSSYALTTAGSMVERQRLVRNLWDRTGSILVLLEPGTPIGFTAIRDARQMILEEENSRRAQLLATLARSSSGGNAINEATAAGASTTPEAAGVPAVTSNTSTANDASSSSYSGVTGDDSVGASPTGGLQSRTQQSGAGTSAGTRQDGQQQESWFSRGMDHNTQIKLQRLGAHVVAPCGHDGECPMQGRKMWCHFAQRFQPPGFMQRAKQLSRSHEDERFSYVVLQRGPRPSQEDVNLSISPQWANEDAQRPASKDQGHLPERVVRKQMILDRVASGRLKADDIGVPGGLGALLMQLQEELKSEEDTDLDEEEHSGMDGPGTDHGRDAATSSIPGPGTGAPRRLFSPGWDARTAGSDSASDNGQSSRLDRRQQAGPTEVAPTAGPSPGAAPPTGVPRDKAEDIEAAQRSMRQLLEALSNVLPTQPAAATGAPKAAPTTSAAAAAPAAPRPPAVGTVPEQLGASVSWLRKPRDSAQRPSVSSMVPGEPSGAHAGCPEPPLEAHHSNLEKRGPGPMSGLSSGPGPAVAPQGLASVLGSEARLGEGQPTPPAPSAPSPSPSSSPPAGLLIGAFEQKFPGYGRGLVDRLVELESTGVKWVSSEDSSVSVAVASLGMEQSSETSGLLDGASTFGTQQEHLAAAEADEMAEAAAPKSGLAAVSATTLNWGLDAQQESNSAAERQLVETQLYRQVFGANPGNSGSADGSSTGHKGGGMKGSMARLLADDGYEGDNSFELHRDHDDDDDDHHDDDEDEDLPDEELAGSSAGWADPRLQRLTQQSSMRWPRIYRAPRHRGRHTILDLCVPVPTPDGQGGTIEAGRLERHVISKSDSKGWMGRPAYHLARHVSWGDLWPSYYTNTRKKIAVYDPDRRPATADVGHTKTDNDNDPHESDNEGWSPSYNPL